MSKLNDETKVDLFLSIIAHRYIHTTSAASHGSECTSISATSFFKTNVKLCVHTCETGCGLTANQLKRGSP